MGSLDLLQKQLQQEYYNLSNRLVDGPSIYDALTDEDQTSTIGYNEHKLLFDQVISNQISNEWKYSNRREIQEIIPGLFLGGFISATKSKKSYLLKHNITHIICIRNEYEANWIKPQHNNQFNYVTLLLDDSFNQNVIPYFQLTNQFILETLRKGGRILVHSNAGISRSSTIVVAFIMFYFKCNSQNAIRYVQNFRFCIHPNESFRRQLFEFEPILSAQLMKRSNELSSNRKRAFTEDKEFEENINMM